MYHKRIEKHTYTGTDYNHSQRTSYKAHIEDDYGAWVAEAPARDDYDQATEDAKQLLEQLTQHK